jgi:shikimate dehydrogenase
VSTGHAPVHRAAVLGKPIAHSLSPVIHNAGYAAAGLAGWTYSAIECAESELADLVAGLGPEWAGLSLTMPLKEVALAVAGAVSPIADAIGAANTLVPDGPGWRAENTDAPGMVDTLAAVGVVAAGRVAVLGAGGTARAAVAAARDLGAEITVYARQPESIAALRPVAAVLGVTMHGAGWADMARCADADVVISTVPGGVAEDSVAAIRWRPTAVLLDAVYDPWPTPLAAAAAAAGCPVVSGLDLLLAQAVRQFDLFTHRPAPVGPMRAALAAARG